MSSTLGVNRPVSESNPLAPSKTRSQTFDAQGNLASFTDFNGNLTTYSYDLARNLETQRVEASGTAQARTISTQWHSTYRLPLKIAEPKRLTSYGYDASGNLTSVTVQATSDTNGSQGFAATLIGSPRTWSYTYNSFGQMLSADGPRSDVNDVISYSYYSATDADPNKRGNLASVTDALSHVVNFTSYDANGRLLTTVDANGLTTAFTYDLRGRLLTRTTAGETTSYQYDGVGQLTQVTLPDSSYLSYSYDGAHRLTGYVDNLGNSVVYTLDAMGNRLKEDVKDPAGSLARTRSHAFDILGRLTQDRDSQNHATQYGYDANSNLTSVTDALNHASSRQYDSLNRLVSVTDPANGTAGYQYDGLDQLTVATDPKGFATSDTVDGLGNRTALTSPDTGNSSDSYDVAGNRLTHTDAKGQVTSYQYDALNRVTQVTYHDGSRELYSYDSGTNGVGRLAQIEERDASNAVKRSTQYGYDALGRVTTETHTVGAVVYAVGYRYQNGRLMGITYPSGRSIDYTRDAGGRISQVTLTEQGNSKTLASQIQYTPFGGVSSYRNGAGQLVSRNYDQDGRLASYTLGGQTWQLAYDAAGRLTSQTDSANVVNQASYGYDTLDRLTSAVVPGSSYGYGYDANGNRSSQTVGAANSSYQYATGSNRLQSITGSMPRSYQLDANGSTTSDGTNQFVYDVRGRLTQATTPSGSTGYELNALGQRVAKHAANDRYYHYDLAGHLIGESVAGGTVKREYIWLGELPLAVLE